MFFVSKFFSFLNFFISLYAICFSNIVSLELFCLKIHSLSDSTITNIIVAGDFIAKLKFTPNWLRSLIRAEIGTVETEHYTLLFVFANIKVPKPTGFFYNCLVFGRSLHFQHSEYLIQLLVNKEYTLLLSPSFHAYVISTFFRYYGVIAYIVLVFGLTSKFISSMYYILRKNILHNNKEKNIQWHNNNNNANPLSRQPRTPTDLNQ